MSPSESTAFLADSPAMLGRKVNNGVLGADDYSLGSPSLRLNGADGDDSGMWDGDDMTMDMLTDVDEDDVDEDVSLVSAFYRSF